MPIKKNLSKKRTKNRRFLHLSYCIGPWTIQERRHPYNISQQHTNTMFLTSERRYSRKSLLKSSLYMLYCNFLSLCFWLFATLATSLIYSLSTSSFLLLPQTHLSIVISFILNLLSCTFFVAQYSEP